MEPASRSLKLEYVQNFFRTSLHKINTSILEVLLFLASLKLSRGRGRGWLENAILMTLTLTDKLGFVNIHSTIKFSNVRTSLN